MAYLSQLNVNGNDYDLKDAEARNNLRSTQSVSGNPLTLTDAAPINAENLVVEFDPKQDLHGQSAPYVGGAGKNKFNSDALSNFTKSGDEYIGKASYWQTDLNNNEGYSGEFKENTQYTFSVVAKNDSNYGTATGFRFYYTDSTYDQIYFNDNVYKYYTITSASGKTVDHISAPYNYQVDLYIKECQLEEGNQATSYAPYSNICPITGYTECNVEDVGNNLFNPQYFLDRGATYSDGYYNGAYAFFKYGVDDFNDATSYKPNTRYVVSYNIYADANVNARVVIKHTDGTTTEASASVTTETRRTVVSAENKSVDKIYTIFSNSGNVHIKDMQIEEGTTPATYVPYTHKSVTIQFGQTVYGGRSNFTDGGTDDEFAHKDLGDLTYYYDSNNTQFYSSEIDDVASGGWHINGVRTSCYKMDVRDYAGFSENHCRGFYGKRLYIIDTRYTDGAALKTALAGQDLVYPKATPDTISTPPTDLKLLQGTNNITTNGTTINLDYIPDNSIGDAVRASEEYTNRQVNREIEKHLEMPYLRILDNDVDTGVKNYRLYYRLISSSYTLVNLAEMLQHRFLFVEVIQNPSGTSNDKLLHSALIDPRTIDGFEYQMKAGTGDTVIIESNIAENKFDLSVQYTGTHTSGDPTDYYVTIRMVD